MEQGELTPERARKLLSEWFAKRHASGVTFREHTDPPQDPVGSYAVAYEAIFEPQSLEHARVEVWITTKAEVAIGFERTSRVSKRLGVRSGRDIFAAGQEPLPINAPGLVAILDTIADGQMAILPTVLPLIGLVSTRAVLPREVADQLVSRGYNSLSWLKRVRDRRFLERARVLRFQPW